VAGEARAIAEVLRARQPIDDVAFDQIYGEHVRRMSAVHWTPIAIAARAAALLAPEPGCRVLDVGAGPGKLCCVGALGFGGHWSGVEHHAALVDAAIATARALEIDDATRFVAGDLDALDWRAFDSLYFYNPFEAVLFGAPHGVGEGGAASFAAQVARAEQGLAQLAPGTRVVTFHGFGGVMPASFTPRVREHLDDGELVLWIQR
jgi:SAM-dependent methyltransferase